MSDTKELQKEINSLSGKLDLFAVTDELVFKGLGQAGLGAVGWGGVGLGQV